MDDIKFVFEPFEDFTFNGTACNCTVIEPGVNTFVSDSLIVIIKPPN